MTVVLILLIVSLTQWLSPKLFPPRNKGIATDADLEKFAGHYSAFFNLVLVTDIGVSVIAYAAFKRLLDSDTSRQILTAIPLLSFGVIPLLVLGIAPLLTSKLWWGGFQLWANKKFSYDYIKVTTINSVLLCIVGLSFLCYGIYFH